ncbi:MAG TPA: PQQ-binding-like beta-propeller repeat protein [Tepidisphaeraceae bacterium]|nr:PQQ-binding-like beta-propeller repeat protein [Tepidisphaeraceae bacterium]
MIKHLVTSLFGLALLAGCAKTSSETGGVSAQPVSLKNKSFATQWGTDLAGGERNAVTAVHVTDKFVFAYREDGTSYVIDRGSGRLLHVDEPKDSTQRFHPPVVLTDRIVYPTTVYLEVFDLSGRYVPHATKPTDELDKPFSQELKYPIRSDVVGVGKTVFFGADFPGSGRAVEVDLTRPYVPEMWTLMEPGSSVSATPALVKDIVYVAAENGTVAAVATDTREPLWTLPKGVFGTYGGVIANLAADATGVYIASTDTKLYCIQRTGGKVKWQYFAGVPLRDGPVLTKDLVFQEVPGTGLVAIDKNQAATPQKPTYNRDARWTAGNAVKMLSEDDNYVYVQTTDNQIAALDKKSGEQRFLSRRNDLAIFGQNTKGDGIVYVATRNARVMAVRPVLTPGQVGELVLAPVAQPALALAH